MTKRQQCGFTLIELIIFIVIVGAGLAGVLSISTTAIKSSADPIVRKQAAALADSILEEILQKEYQDPDGLPNVVESGRATYDDVDDYDGINETLSALGPRFTGLPSNVYGYVVTVAVTAPGLGTIPAKRVSVTVSRGTESVSMVGYRTNY
jgi:MSHA pilin protein MshD